MYVWLVLRHISDAVKQFRVEYLGHHGGWPHYQEQKNIHVAAGRVFTITDGCWRLRSKLTATTAWKHIYKQVSESSEDVAAWGLCLATCLWLWEVLTLSSFKTQSLFVTIWALNLISIWKFTPYSITQCKGQISIIIAGCSKMSTLHSELFIISMLRTPKTEVQYHDVSGGMCRLWQTH